MLGMVRDLEGIFITDMDGNDGYPLQVQTVPRSVRQELP